MRVVQARCGGHIHEVPVAVVVGFVVIEDKAPPRSRHKIIEAVVVEVANRATHPVARTAQADCLRYVCKRSVTIIPVQLVRGQCIVSWRWPNETVLNTEQIEPSVVVIVDPAQAAPHRL